MKKRGRKNHGDTNLNQIRSMFRSEENYSSGHSLQRGHGLIKISGKPIELVEHEILRYKTFESVPLLGRHRFAGIDMRIRVKSGGHTSQIYAILHSISKALVAFYEKYVDEQSKKDINDILGRYEGTLLVANPRHYEPKKFGGRGARSRFKKSYD